MGVTQGPDCARPFARLDDGTPEGASSVNGRVVGTYVHGLFADDRQRAAWLARLDAGPSTIAYDELVESTLDRLAKSAEGYPPYNIEKIGENGLRITLAVAGFRTQDLAIELVENQLTVRGKQNDIHTFELIWQESEEELTAMSTRPAIRPVGLKLTHGARDLDLDQNSPPISLGRDAQNDVVIMDRKASRLHARIERRRDKFVIVDLSSNGTFCTVKGESEIMLRREELILRGSGRLSFGHSGEDPLGEVVEYVCL